MSGPICPDCDWGIIREGAPDPSGASCVLCGWIGERLPYKRLHIRDHEVRCAERDAKVARRDAGTLHFLRVDYDPALPEPDAESLAAAIQALIGTTPKNWRSFTPGAYFYCELESRPTPECLKGLAVLPNATGARLHPAPGASGGDAPVT